MTVKRRTQLRAADIAYLIMPGVGLSRLDVRQVLRRGPGPAVNAALVVQTPLAGIFGKEEEKSLILSSGEKVPFDRLIRIECQGDFFTVITGGYDNVEY